MADPKVHPQLDPSNALALLEAGDRRRLAGALLAIASTLLAEEKPPAAPGDELLPETALVGPFFTSARTLREAVRSGALVASRAGRKLVVRRADLDAYLAACRTRPSVKTDVPRDDDEAALARAGLRVVGGRR